MSIKIISKRCRQTRTMHFLAFSRTDLPGAGYSFECDVDGNLINPPRDKDTDPFYQEVLREVAAGTHLGPFREESHNGWIEPAVGECHCGAEVQLSDPLDNGCDNCGRFYNMCGQEVVSPDSDLGRALRAEDDRYADEA